MSVMPWHNTLHRKSHMLVRAAQLESERGDALGCQRWPKPGWEQRFPRRDLDFNLLHIPRIAGRINKRSAYKGNVISNFSFCSMSLFIISFS